jgi:hypothetical protein
MMRAAPAETIASLVDGGVVLAYRLEQGPAELRQEIHPAFD